MSPADFVDPADLASTPMTPEPSHSQADSGPSRKRARTELTSEDKKEARAHRNRIAAQNSRDRRKAQFSYLERRVAELEEENKHLRAGMGMSRVDEQKAEEQERERARERENAELRERIRTLEKGWDAVVKALAAQGLPTGVAPPTPMSESAQSPSSTDSTSSHPTSPQTAAPEPPLSAQKPVSNGLSVMPTMVFPISPAPTTTSMDLDLPSPNMSAFDDFAVPSFAAEQSAPEQVSTRHLARVATIADSPSPMSLQRVVPSSRTLSVAKQARPVSLPYRLTTHTSLLTMPQWTTFCERSSPPRLTCRLRVYLRRAPLRRPPQRRK
ncbi:hypothetical protein BD626DRAFT_391362 [Schizophyllum amplum]|uniref:X-box-binding protein 1 n=1 Tax=Schizophyllum amplum TaxID=97359 RepID=A0A550CWX1_9AGAR|nr:hypothetical protein BD626DRAFT_391362 [Auriculariopsis ampla]